MPTWYATSNLVSVHQEMSETDPGTEAFASPTTGWVVGTTGTGTGAFNSQVESSTFSGTNPDGSIDTSTGDCLRTTNTYTGSFAAANWTVNFCCRSVTNVAGQGRMLCRLFRSANADGSSATEINTGTKTGSTVTLSTTVTQNSTVTFNPGAFSVANEYIFIQLAWERISAAGMSTADVNMRIGNSASLGTRVVSSTFSPIVSGTLTIAGSSEPAFVGDFTITTEPEKNLFFNPTPILFSRSVLYPTSFDAPLGPVFRSGAFGIAGSSTVAFIGATTPALAQSQTNTPIPFYRSLLYPSLFEPIPPLAATLSGTLAISGSSTVAFIGSQVLSGALTVVGNTSASFVGAATSAGTLTVSLGTAVAWVGSFTATNSGALIIQGSTTVDFIGRSTVQGTLSISGSTTAAFSGVALKSTTLTIAGSTTIAFTGQSIAQGTLSISGSTTAAFGGSALKPTALTISGSSTIAFVGRSISATTLSIALGTSVAWVGTFVAAGTGLMLVSGSTTVAFIGRSSAATTLSIGGSTTVAFVGAATEVRSGQFGIGGSSDLAFIGTEGEPPVASLFSMAGSTEIAWLGERIVEYVPPPEGYESQVGVWHVRKVPLGSRKRWSGRTGKRYRIYGAIPEPPVPVGPLWILDDGYWHDLGIWIDTEVWED